MQENFAMKGSLATLCQLSTVDQKCGQLASPLCHIPSLVMPSIQSWRAEGEPGHNETPYHDPGHAPFYGKEGIHPFGIFLSIYPQEDE